MNTQWPMPPTVREVKIQQQVSFELEQAYALGWRDTKPVETGPYQRLCALGIKVDFWDGFNWRRISSSSGRPFPGVICANQDLPWRIHNSLVP